MYCYLVWHNLLVDHKMASNLRSYHGSSNIYPRYCRVYSTFNTKVYLVEFVTCWRRPKIVKHSQNWGDRRCVVYGWLHDVRVEHSPPIARLWMRSRVSISACFLNGEPGRMPHVMWAVILRPRTCPRTSSDWVKWPIKN